MSPCGYSFYSTGIAAASWQQTSSPNLITKLWTCIREKHFNFLVQTARFITDNCPEVGTVSVNHEHQLQYRQLLSNKPTFSVLKGRKIHTHTLEKITTKTEHILATFKTDFLNSCLRESIISTIWTCVQTRTGNSIQTWCGGDTHNKSSTSHSTTW